MSEEAQKNVPKNVIRKKPKTISDALFYFICTVIIVGNFALEFIVGGHEGSKEGSAISNQIPVPHNAPGLDIWIVNLYNSNKLLFAIVVTIAMAVIGIIIAMITELILRLFGLKVSKIAHHE